MKKYIFIIAALFCQSSFAANLKGLDGIKFGDKISSYNNLIKVEKFYIKDTKLLDFTNVYIDATPLSKIVTSLFYRHTYSSESYCKEKQKSIEVIFSENLKIKFIKDGNFYKQIDPDGISIYFSCDFSGELKLMFVSIKNVDIGKKEYKEMELKKNKIEEDFFIN